MTFYNFTQCFVLSEMFHPPYQCSLSCLSLAHCSVFGIRVYAPRALALVLFYSLTLPFRDAAFVLALPQPLATWQATGFLHRPEVPCWPEVFWFYVSGWSV